MTGGGGTALAASVGTVSSSIHRRFSMRLRFTPIFASLAAIAFVTGCQTAPKTDTARANLLDEAQASLNRFERSDNSLRDVLDRSPGFVVFPAVGKGGFIVGGGYGKGVV